MFSLIITVVSIVLVLALVAASVYYGGRAYLDSSTEAVAAKILSQGPQLLSAAELHRVDAGAWPVSLDSLRATNYLKSVPTSRGLDDTGVAINTEWVMPSPGKPVFLLSHVSPAVCRSINKKVYGIAAVRKTASSKYIIQCFGASIETLRAIVSKTGEDLTDAAADAESGGLIGVVSPTPAPMDPLSPEWADVTTPTAPGEVTYERDSNATTTLLFPSTLEGTASLAQTVIVRNSGGKPVELNSAPKVTPPFTLASSSCTGVTLAPAATCAVAVVFEPPHAGSFKGLEYFLGFSSSSNTLTQLLLAGEGAAVPLFAELDVNINQLDLGDVAAGVTKSAEIVVSNPGTGPLTLHPSTVTGNPAFSLGTSTCGALLVTKGSCVIGVNFKPTQSGAVTGTLTINSDVGVHQVPLAGKGPSPAAGVSAISVNFGTLYSGSTSTSRPVTLTNTGNTPLTLSGIVASANFGQSSNCGSSLAVSASCTVNVTFKPTYVGTVSGKLTFSTSAGTTEVSLSGTGTAPAPTGTMVGYYNHNGNNFVFSRVALGSTSTLFYIYTNTGSTTSTGITASVSGSSADVFVEPLYNTCNNATILPGKTCEVTFKFAPKKVQNWTGTLRIGPASVSATGSTTGA